MIQTNERESKSRNGRVPEAGDSSRTNSSLNEKQETHSLQLPELKTGVYLYSIETLTGMQSGKLLIE